MNNTIRKLKTYFKHKPIDPTQSAYWAKKIVVCLFVLLAISIIVAMCSDYFCFLPDDFNEFISRSWSNFYYGNWVGAILFGVGGDVYMRLFATIRVGILAAFAIVLVRNKKEGNKLLNLSPAQRIFWGITYTLALFCCLIGCFAALVFGGSNRLQF